MPDQQFTPSLRPFHRRATVECSLAYMGSVLSFLANSSETGGGLSVLLAHARIGSEPPPHLHHREHELFYVLDGEVEFFCEGEKRSFLVGRGGMAFLPQGDAHAMYFRTPEVHMLAILHAAEGNSVGTESYLKQMAVGPAVSMDLPRDGGQYSTASAVDMQDAFRRATANGLTLLSPEEIAQRLPLYPGYGSNLPRVSGA